MNFCIKVLAQIDTFEYVIKQLNAIKKFFMKTTKFGSAMRAS